MKSLLLLLSMLTLLSILVYFNFINNNNIINATTSRMIHTSDTIISNNSDVDTLHIAIITFYQNQSGSHYYRYQGIYDNQPDMVSESLTNFHVYAKKHGYYLYFLNDEWIDNNKQSYWGKLSILLNFLMNEEISKKIDWIFYTDIDYLFVNIGQSFEEKFNKYFLDDNIHIIAPLECINQTKDWQSMSGNFFIRNSKLVKLFLSQWIVNGYKMFSHTINPEQRWFGHALDPRKNISQNNDYVIKYNLRNPFNNKSILNDKEIYYYKNILKYNTYLDVTYHIKNHYDLMTYPSKECHPNNYPKNLEYLVENHSIFGFHFVGHLKTWLIAHSNRIKKIYPKEFKHQFKVSLTSISN
eukprot:484161_1